MCVYVCMCIVPSRFTTLFTKMILWWWNPIIIKKNGSHTEHTPYLALFGGCHALDFFHVCSQDVCMCVRTCAQTWCDPMPLLVRRQGHCFYALPQSRRRVRLLHGSPWCLHRRLHGNGSSQPEPVVWHHVDLAGTLANTKRLWDEWCATTDFGHCILVRCEKT